MSSLPDEAFERPIEIADGAIEVRQEVLRIEELLGVVRSAGIANASSSVARLSRSRPWR